jgi:hypothetical protein
MPSPLFFLAGLEQEPFVFPCVMSTGEEGMSYRKGLAGGRSVILPVR